MVAMNCWCVSCISKSDIQTPVMYAGDIRIGEIERFLWKPILDELAWKDRMSLSAVCKRLRYITVKVYKSKNDFCFGEMYKDFLKSRHIVLLDCTDSMISDNGHRQALIILKKLSQVIEKPIKTRGVFVGRWGCDYQLKHVKTKDSFFNYFNGLSINGCLYDFSDITSKLSDKLKILKAELDTQIHIISDMCLSGNKFINSYRTNSSKQVFHFYPVVKLEDSHAFIQGLTENFENRKKDKKRKFEDLDVIIHPFRGDPQVTKKLNVSLEEEDQID